MQCWNCGTGVDLDRISFRSVCEKCNSYLHCCVNCRYYQPGLANDCQIPGTERVLDRQKNNFCEEFSVSQKIGKLQEKKDFKRFEDLFS